MKVVDGLHLAQDLVEKHLPSEWCVILVRSRTLAGECVHSKHEIRINIDSILHYNRKQLIDVVLHEIAHALAGPGKGHGLAWAEKALELGIEPHDTAPAVKKPAHAYNNPRAWLGMIAIIIGAFQVSALLGILGVVPLVAFAVFMVWEKFGPIEKVYNL